MPSRHYQTGVTPHRPSRSNAKTQRYEAPYEVGGPFPAAVPTAIKFHPVGDPSYPGILVREILNLNPSTVMTDCWDRVTAETHGFVLSFDVGLLSWAFQIN